VFLSFGLQRLRALRRETLQRHTASRLTFSQRCGGDLLVWAWFWSAEATGDRLRGRSTLPFPNRKNA
jgi:hypothetical protein